jgi:NADP-dependent 3-hydroxy acid dehydrogenase YdfG
MMGAVSFVPFAALSVALWKARDRFQAPRRTLRERYGEWALVTGASSGIGAAFARALAREGCSVVLSARRGERLEALAAEIAKECAVATRVVAVDLASPEGATQLVAAVEDLEIAVLVNNAGFGYAGRFERRDEQRLVEMIQVHCTAPLVLTHRLLPKMRSRGRGAVVFTGSLAAKQPMPLHATYAATKAFVELLGGSAELRGSGVDVGRAGNDRDRVPGGCRRGAARGRDAGARRRGGARTPRRAAVVASAVVLAAGGTGCACCPDPPLARDDFGVVEKRGAVPRGWLLASGPRIMDQAARAAPRPARGVLEQFGTSVARCGRVSVVAEPSGLAGDLPIAPGT